MGQRICFGLYLPLLIVLFAADFLMVDARMCEPSGEVVEGKHYPRGRCNQKDNSDCCKQGKHYKTYECSPPVTKETKAILTLNDFQQGGDGGGASECDGQYHSDDTPVVALSTGWFNKKSRCNRYINIRSKGRSVKAMVVDECDSTVGCDKDHNYEPPCRYNIVDASKAVWEALGVPHDNWGELEVVWSDA